jgi:uncharacterized membrane protein
MKLNRRELILLLIASLALFLRIYHIAEESIWLDEGISIHFANLDLFDILEKGTQESHPPLYYIILHYWINMFGDSEFSTRFLSTLFGLFSILMIYKVASHIFDRDVGILSSLVLALSVFHIHYSQEVRNYALVALLTLFSFYFFIKLFEKNTPRATIGYIISSTLLIYTHVVSGPLVIVAQDIYLFTLLLFSTQIPKVDLKRWLFPQVIVFALFTPWLWILISQMSVMGKLISWIPTPSISTVKDSITQYAGSQKLLLVFLLLSFLSIVTCKKLSGSIHWTDLFKSIERYRWSVVPTNVHKIYLILVWLLTPIILPFIISQFSTTIYLTKVTIPASLAFYLLVGKGMRNINNRYVKLATLCIVIALSLINLRGYYNDAHKEQWRDVAKFMDSNAKPGDLLLFNSGTCLRVVFDYYSKRADLIKKPFPEKTKYVDEQNIKELKPAMEGPNRIWLILSHSGDYKGLIKKALNESYDLSYHKKYIGIKVHLFEKM